MLKPFIAGERVYLRALETDDAELLVRCNNTPEVRYSFFIAFPTNTVRQNHELAGLYDRQEYVPFAICDRNDDRAVGITAFHRLDLVSRAAVFSIRIANPEDWGRGYGGEVTRLMVTYGFETLNLNRIQLVVFTGNERGIRAYEKAGFVKEGLLRQAMYHNNEYCDFHIMSILRDEYYSAQKNRPSRTS
ncbi:MAG TPA: GNAT family protein [Candidatus Sumerlaeota bacterium]|nr:GNAT family protein [Candidatus Sumerlaeota bacterium]